jgi:hypothetical protein
LDNSGETVGGVAEGGLEGVHGVALRGWKGMGEGEMGQKGRVKWSRVEREGARREDKVSSTKTSREETPIRQKLTVPSSKLFCALESS